MEETLAAMAPPWLQRCIAAPVTHASVVVIAALATAWNSRENGFVWDDRAAILGNADVNASESHWWELFQHDFWGYAINTSTSHKSYRPLTVLTFRWDRSLHGLDARGFHLTNVCLHALCSFLVWWTATIVLNRKTGRRIGAIVAGLLFSVHPIHCDSVASVVGRADLLCVACSLVGFHFYDVAERCNSWSHVAAAIGLGVCACLCKELGITVFGIYVAHSITRALASGDHRFTVHHASVLRVFSVVTSALGLLIARLWVNGEQTKATFNILANSINKEESRIIRIMSYAHVHAWYLWKLVWPSWLSYDYGFNTIPVITTVFDARNALTAMAYAAVIIGVLKGSRDVNHSPLLMCIAFGVIPFVPASNIFFPVGTVVAERLLYFPSVGFCLLVGLAVGEFAAALVRMEDRVRRASRAMSQNVRLLRRSCVASLGVIFIAAMCKSVVRNADWKTEETLFAAAVDVVPENVKALNNAAKIFLNKDPERARLLARASIAIMPRHVEGQSNLGLAYTHRTHKILAIRHMVKAFAFSPHETSGAGYAGTHLFDYWMQQHNASTVSVETMMQSPTVQLSLSFLDNAIQRGSRTPVHYYQRGIISERLDDLPAALRFMEAARRMNDRVVRLGLDGEMVLERGPLHNRVAILHRQMGNDDDALTEFLAGIDLYPSEPTLYFNTAGILMARGQLDKATQFLERCLRVCQGADLMREGARLLERLGQQEAAKAFVERVAVLHGELV